MCTVLLPPGVNPIAVKYIIIIILKEPIPVATRNKAWVCGCSLAGIADSHPAGAWVSVRYECVFSDRGLCDGVITRPEDSYPV
jgi:hypothetical protein